MTHPGIHVSANTRLWASSVCKTCILGLLLLWMARGDALGLISTDQKRLNAAQLKEKISFGPRNFKQHLSMLVWRTKQRSSIF